MHNNFFSYDQYRSVFPVIGPLFVHFNVLFWQSLFHQNW